MQGLGEHVDRLIHDGPEKLTCVGEIVLATYREILASSIETRTDDYHTRLAFLELHVQPILAAQPESELAVACQSPEARARAAAGGGPLADLLQTIDAFLSSKPDPAPHARLIAALAANGFKSASNSVKWAFFRARYALAGIRERAESRFGSEDGRALLVLRYFFHHDADDARTLLDHLVPTDDGELPEPAAVVALDDFLALTVLVALRQLAGVPASGEIARALLASEQHERSIFGAEVRFSSSVNEDLPLEDGARVMRYYSHGQMPFTGEPLKELLALRQVLGTGIPPLTMLQLIVDVGANTDEAAWRQQMRRIASQPAPSGQLAEFVADVLNTLRGDFVARSFIPAVVEEGLGLDLGRKTVEAAFEHSRLPFVESSLAYLRAAVAVAENADRSKAGRLLSYALLRPLRCSGLAAPTPELVNEYWWTEVDLHEDAFADALVVLADVTKESPSELLSVPIPEERLRKVTTMRRAALLRSRADLAMPKSPERAIRTVLDGLGIDDAVLSDHVAMREALGESWLVDDFEFYRAGPRFPADHTGQIAAGASSVWSTNTLGLVLAEAYRKLERFDRAEVALHSFLELIENRALERGEVIQVLLHSTLTVINPRQVWRLEFAKAWLRSLEHDVTRLHDELRVVMSFLRKLFDHGAYSTDQRRALLEESLRIWHLALPFLVGDRSSPAILGDMLRWAEEIQAALVLDRLFQVAADQTIATPGLELEPGKWPFAVERPQAELDGSAPTSPLTVLPPPPPTNAKKAKSATDKVEPAAYASALPYQLANMPPMEQLFPPGAVCLRFLELPDQSLCSYALRRKDNDIEAFWQQRSQPRAGVYLDCAFMCYRATIEVVWQIYSRSGWQSDELEVPLIKKLVEVVDSRRFSDMNEELVTFWQAIPEKTPALGGVLSGLLPDSEDIVRQHLTCAWPKIAELLSPWHGTSRDRDVRRRAALQQATADYLAAVQGSFALDGLADAGRHIGVDWPNTDVMFHGLASLTNAPLAWLPFDAGEPLWRRAASTSTVVSLALRHAMAESPPLEGEASRRILSAHWPSQMHGLVNLHHEIETLAQEATPWTVWAIGDDPPATGNLIANALSAGHRVAVIGGHGSALSSGVELKDGLWHGDGQLGSVDLLILAACSVGALNQPNLADIEGLYANMAENGIRSVVAARCPVAEDETARMVAEIVRAFRARVGAAAETPPFARARALNDARRTAIDGRGVTDHVASAFELYGLG